VRGQDLPSGHTASCGQSKIQAPLQWPCISANINTKCLQPLFMTDGFLYNYRMQNREEHLPRRRTHSEASGCGRNSDCAGQCSARVRVFSSEQIPIFSYPATSLAPFLRSGPTFASVLCIFGCTYSRPSLNRLCHSKALDFFTAYSP
jgi:hypothetical protein